MIRITRATDNPKLLSIAVKPGFPLEEDTTIWFLHECASELEGQLLCELLQRNLGDTLAIIRKASYFRGWKHAKAKKAGKRIWFSTACSLLPWETKEAGL